jgi:type IV secretion system protein VirB11
MSAPKSSATSDANDSVYLRAYLEPFRRWLERDDVSEILVNRPGEAWIEMAGEVSMLRIPAASIDDSLLRRLSEQVARVNHQGVDRAWPLISATLPGGERIELVGPPAARSHWALAIRRQRVKELDLSDYACGPLDEAPPATIEIDAADPTGTLRHAIAARATILISGGTSSGKTTFLNALLREVAPTERVILVEETPEIQLKGGNWVGLIAVKGALGEAQLTTDDLLQAALRLRPDRIVLGELRGREAVSFLQAVNAGHQGSFATIQANSPRGALEQLAMMVMQSGLGLSRNDTIAYACSVIDLVVQLDRRGGRRGIARIATTRELVSDPR